MNPAILDTSTVIVGQSGSGKTVTAKDLVRQLLDQRRHVAIIDPTGVWWGMRADPAGKPNGSNLDIFGGDHGDVSIRPDQGAAIARIIIQERISAIVDLSAIDNSADWRMFAHDFVAELRGKPKGNFHLIVDEADEFAAERVADDVGFRLRENMVWIAKRGRVHGFVPTYITQRTAEIAKAVISQAKTVIVHALMLPADQKPIDDYLKGHGSADTRKALMGSLSELDTGERWIYSPRLQLLERGTTPAMTTFDSSRTPEPGETLIEPRTLAQLDVSAIRAALAPPTSAMPDDAFAADPSGAYKQGQATGAMIVQRDRRITELEALLAYRDAELEHLRGVDEECDGYNAGLTAIENLVVKVRSGTWRTDLQAANASSGTTPDLETAPARNAATAESASQAAVSGNSLVASDALDLPPRRIRIAEAIGWANAYLKQPSVPRTIVAWIAETTTLSSTFERDLGAMRTAGLITYPAAGELALTDAGRAIAPLQSMPRTRDTLWEAIAVRLEPRRIRIVHALWAGAPMSREDLACAIETSSASSTFERDLGRMRTLGLVEYPAPGLVIFGALLR